MKFMKYLFVLTFALCTVATVTKAQGTVVFLASGSSALFNELGQAAFTSSTTATPCLWTYGTSSPGPYATLSDNRTSPATVEDGSIWVTWGLGTGTSCASPAGTYNVYAYMSLDSVLGDRCYFETPTSGGSGCVLSFNPPAGTAGLNKICYPQPTASCTEYKDSTGGIPAGVITALNGQHVNAAGTDIRPEDAKFASYRMFTTCGTGIWRQPFDQGLRQVYGLGYQTGTTGVGTPITSYYGGTFHVLDFNITGNDPISGQPVPGYTVSTVGAQPIIVAVNGPNISAARDVNGFTLTLFYQGVLGRTTDLIGPTTTAPVTVLVREPLSGTYNTFEWSIPNSSQFHGSQDDNNCTGSTVYSNPMDLQSTNGAILSYRQRVIGTSQMVSTLQGFTSSDAIGYFFWSQSNAAAFTDSNGRYLTVNGVDPLQTPSAYVTPGVFDGIIPGADSSHPISNVTFAGLNSGDYPIWSALRIVSGNPTPAGVTNLITAVQGLDSTQHDFVTLANLKVWHSHSYLPSISVNVGANGNTLNPATPNDLCASSGALGELGNDAGGANTLKQANFDFCSDYGNIDGLINKAN
jgi:ABC-type phosphate transport system substrate-binding protein